jgi:hypothetical protein
MPPAGPVSPGRLAALLRELGPRLCSSADLTTREAPARRPSGIAALDRLLGGGFPCGRLSEISGPASSGRTSLAVALLAATTRAGESAALVDAADTFDPASAAAAGADLARTLWVRAPRPREALRAAEILVAAGGFALVVLDLPSGGEALPAARWLRLARAATTGTACALVALAPGARAAGPSAELALELRPARPRFTGRPALLEALETEAVLVRRRGGAPGGIAALRFRSVPT